MEDEGDGNQRRRHAGVEAEELDTRVAAYEREREEDSHAQVCEKQEEHHRWSAEDKGDARPRFICQVAC